MKVQHLAEAIIMQSIEDLWDGAHRDDSIHFFAGKDFRTCASAAGIDVAGQIKILKMLEKPIKDTKIPMKKAKKLSSGYAPRGAEFGEAVGSH